MNKSEPTPYPDFAQALDNSLTFLEGLIEGRCAAGGLTVGECDLLRDVRASLTEAREIIGKEVEE